MSRSILRVLRNGLGPHPSPPPVHWGRELEGLQGYGRALCARPYPCNPERGALPLAVGGAGGWHDELLNTLIFGGGC